MITLEIGDKYADFLAGRQLAGRYVFANEFKPYLHPLKTPRGRTVSLLSPHDHKHHRGLMYALRTREVNFWEEFATLPGEVVGRQRHDAINRQSTDDAVGFVQALTWLPLAGGAPVFRERRAFDCRLGGDGAAFVWTWETTIEALVDSTLVMSQWSAPRPDGALVNYHGLGIRFRRDWGCTGGNTLLVDGRATEIEHGLGRIVEEIAFTGSIDGTWPVERATVSIRQFQPNGLFVMDRPFAFIGLGPSNLAERRLQVGDQLQECYEVAVTDEAAPPSNGGSRS